jgi:ribosomal protein S18 acetylase RimI-like enzyme
MPIDIITADYANPAHAAAVLDLLDAYAQDPMGGSAPLAPDVRARLVPALAGNSHALSLLAYAGGEPVGLANCFEGFSTFAARPLLNIHDVFVAPAYRGQGVVQALLAGVEAIAVQRGCCKLTLEVLQANRRAQAAYRRAGFGDHPAGPPQGAALFWQKKLAP